jgi:spermidine synthase
MSAAAAPDSVASDSGWNPAPFRLTAFGLVFLSGFAGLAYQVVWVRMLSSVFGVTAFAIGTVLASFMAGLALGSWSFGRYIDRHPRPILTYALLEAGIGIYALLVPWLFHLSDAIFKISYAAVGDSFILQSSVRAVLSFAILVVPTTFMGATLPVLCKFFIRQLVQVGDQTGRLYFVNTFGAVFGCAVAGFVMVPSMGLLATTLIAAALNVAVAIVAYGLHRVAQRASRPAPAPRPAEPPSPPAARHATANDGPRGFAQRWVLVAFALSGFVALIFEVVWSRILILVFGSTVYSFSAMLSVFLLGLSIGSVIFGRRADRVRHPMQLLAWVLSMLAFVVLLENWIVNLLPYAFLKGLWRGGFSFASLTAVKLVLSFLILFPAAILFGGTFPIVSRIHTDSLEQAGTRIGTVYAANTLGAILGSVGGGFILLPWLGARGCLIVISAVLALIGCVTFLVPSGRQRRLAIPITVGVAFAVTAVLAPPWNRQLLALGVYFQPRVFFAADGHLRLESIQREVRTLYYEEGLNDTVIVTETPTERALSINGKVVATSSRQDVLHLKMLGHLPILVHPRQPRRMLNIGFGIGGTVSALASHDVERIDVVELEAAVVGGARLFAAVNDHVLDDPKVHVSIGDGRTVLATTRERFDVVSSDPFHPFITGAGNLYAREYLELGRDRLAPDGLMTQWLPMHQVGDREFRAVVKTFASVFPHYTIWFGGECVILIGSNEPMAVNVEALAAKLQQERAAPWLASLGLDSPAKFLSFLLADEHSLRGYADDVPLNTDSRPFVEYAAARRIYDETTGSNLEGMAPYFIPVEQLTAYVSGNAAGLDRGEVVRRARAVRTCIDGVIDLSHGDVAGLDKLAHGAAVSGDPFLRRWTANAHEAFGITALEENALDAATARFETALGCEPDRVTSLAHLGYVCYLGGRYAEALEYLQRAEQLQPTNQVVQVRLAAVYAAGGDQPRARASASRALSLDPTSPEAMNMLAFLKLTAGDVAGAEQLFRDCLAKRPEFAEARQGLAEVLIRQGKLDEAERELQHRIDAAPETSVTRMLSAEIHMQRRHFDRAAQCYADAAALDPANPEAPYRLARAYAAQSIWPPARAALEQAVTLGGDRFASRAAADPLLRSLVSSSP